MIIPDDDVGPHVISRELFRASVRCVPGHEHCLADSWGGVRCEGFASCVVIQELDSDFVGFVHNVLLSNEQGVREALDRVGRCNCCSRFIKYVHWCCWNNISVEVDAWPEQKLVGGAADGRACEAVELTLYERQHQ